MTRSTFPKTRGDLRTLKKLTGNALLIGFLKKSRKLLFQSFTTHLNYFEKVPVKSPLKENKDKTEVNRSSNFSKVQGEI